MDTQLQEELRTDKVQNIMESLVMVSGLGMRPRQVGRLKCVRRLLTLAFIHSGLSLIFPSSGCEQGPIVGPRYKCAVCPGAGFDLCGICSKDTAGHTSRFGSSHVFIKLDQPRKKSPGESFPMEHDYIRCDSCEGSVAGPRYKCELRDQSEVREGKTLRHKRSILLLFSTASPLL